jgi:ribosomal protein S18 acetylase RimI-like enzyme
MLWQLREAVAGDAAQIAEVYLASRRVLVACAPLAHTEEDVRGWVANTLVPRGGVTVAVAGQVVVGFVAVSSADGVGWIDQLYVLPGLVGQGCGSQLLAQALRQLPRPVRLFTFQANARARRFYEARGFVVVASGDGSDNEERCPDLLCELRCVRSG